MKPRFRQRRRARQSSFTRSAGYLRCDGAGGFALFLDGSSSAPGAAHRHAGWRGWPRPGRRGAATAQKAAGLRRGSHDIPPAPEAPHAPAATHLEAAAARRKLGVGPDQSARPSRYAGRRRSDSRRVAPGNIGSAGFPRDCTGLICPSAVSGQLPDSRRYTRSADDPVPSNHNAGLSEATPRAATRRGEKERVQITKHKGGYVVLSPGPSGLAGSCFVRLPINLRNLSPKGDKAYARFGGGVAPINIGPP